MLQLSVVFGRPSPSMSKSVQPRSSSQSRPSQSSGAPGNTAVSSIHYSSSAWCLGRLGRVEVRQEACLSPHARDEVVTRGPLVFQAAPSE